MPTACMTRATPGGRPDGSGGGGGGGPSDGGASLAVRELRSAKRSRELVGRRPARARHQRAHLVEAGVDEVLGVVDAALGREPATGRERRAAHDPRRPDVAEDAAFVAQAVHEARLAEQLVELRAVLLGHLRADVGDAARRRPSVSLPGAVDGRADRAQQRVGQLERVATGDVEAVEQPAADEVEVVRHRRADLAVERAQLGEHLAGVAVGRRAARERPVSFVIAAMSRSSSPDAPADTGAAPRIIASAVGRRDGRSTPRGARAGRRPASSPTP